MEWPLGNPGIGLYDWNSWRIKVIWHFCVVELLFTGISCWQLLIAALIETMLWWPSRQIYEIIVQLKIRLSLYCCASNKYILPRINLDAPRIRMNFNWNQELSKSILNTPKKMVQKISIFVSFKLKLMNLAFVLIYLQVLMRYHACLKILICNR